jgi:hypothetical protein
MSSGVNITAEYLVQAWVVHNTCKHSGAALPLLSAPMGRGSIALMMMSVCYTPHAVCCCWSTLAGGGFGSGMCDCSACTATEAY